MTTLPTSNAGLGLAAIYGSVRHPHHPLSRRIDRIEAAAVVVLLIVAVIGLIPMGVLSRAVYEHGAAQAAAAAASHTLVTATTVEKASGSAPTPRAVWSFRGVTHTGAIYTETDVPRGAQRQIWVDAHGLYAGQLPTRVGALTNGICAGLAGLFFLFVALGEGVRVLHKACERRRGDRWDSEWAQLDQGRLGGIR